MTRQIVEAFDRKSATDAELRAFYDLWIEQDRFFVPDDPPYPYEWYSLDWLHAPEEWKTVDWVIRDGDTVAAFAGIDMDMEQNLENAMAWVFVHPDHRGKGYATRLAAPMFDGLEEHGRIRVSFRVPEGASSQDLLTRIGAPPALRMRRSRLRVADVDRALMDTWIARAQERAAEYDVIFLPSPVPDEHLEAFAKVQDVMNEAPMEDLVMDPEVTTPELWRKIEKFLALRKDLLLSYVAVHRSSGEFVGFTNLNIQTLNPTIAWVWNTGIHPDHRNKGLGRWIKAEMMNRVLDEYPHVERLDTFNAGSNEAMLNINEAMGFKSLMYSINHQGETAEIRRNLGV